MSQGCGSEPTRPTDNPSEFSRAPVYVVVCESSEGLKAAASEDDVGPRAIALRYGRPHRAGL